MLVVLLAACPVPLRAQSAPAGGKPAAEFSCLIWEPLPITAVFYRNGKEVVPLELSPGNRSRLYPLKETTGLELYTVVTGPDGKATYKLVGKAPLVAGTRRMLFLIEPVPQATELPLKIVGVDDSLDAFPPGTFRFFNFSALPLQVRFGGQTDSLPVDEVKVVRSNVPLNGGLLPIYISDINRKTLFENRIIAQPDLREMVFIRPPARPGASPKVKFVTEPIPAKPPTDP